MNPNIPPQSYNQAAPYFQGSAAVSGHPMMWMFGNNQGALWFAGILWFITWILVLVTLVAIIRWLWAKGDEVKKK